LSGGVATLTLVGGDNLSPDATCLVLGAAALQAAPDTVASIGDDPPKPLAVLPQPTSPAVDAWPAEACTADLEQPLQHDLRGGAGSSCAGGRGRPTPARGGAPSATSVPASAPPA